MRTTSMLATIILVTAVTIGPAWTPAPAAAPVVEDPVYIEGLGSLSFPNSGAPEAQEPFLRGVLLLHSFEYRPAAEAFREAQEIDPDFALAYWGEAMTHNHPLWRQKDTEAAMEVLERLAPTASERRAMAESEREAMYLDALEALYGDGTKTEQDRAYMEAMEALVQAHPEDDEARAFYALSILGSTNGTRDFATYMKAAATADPVFERNPDHPGAAHYLIHSFDDPIHAPLGLPAALAYSDIAPNAAHAQHMTSHIFVAMGMWEDVVTANTRARDTQDADFAARGEPPNVCGHYSSWLQYGHLQLGEVDEAEALLDLCHQRVVEGGGPGDWGYFANMRARQILDTEDWEAADRWQAELPADDPRLVDSPVEAELAFTDAFAALKRGEPGPAEQLLAAHGDTENEAIRVHLEELRGLLALHHGHVDAGIEHLRSAAEAEDAMPYAFGPPQILKPTFELLGEALLELGRVEEAEEAFRRATERTPGRVLSVEGLESAEGATEER